MGRTQGTGRTLSLSPDTVNLSPGSHPGQAPGSGTQVRLQTPVGPGVGGTQRVWGGLGEPEAKDPPMSGVQGKTLRPRPPGGQAGGGASSSGTQGPAPLTAPPRLRGRVQTAPSSGQRPTSEGEWPWGSAPCFPSCSVAPTTPGASLSQRQGPSILYSDGGGRRGSHGGSASRLPGGLPSTRVLLGSVTVGVESICKESSLSRAPRVQRSSPGKVLLPDHQSFSHSTNIPLGPVTRFPVSPPGARKPLWGWSALGSGVVGTGGGMLLSRWPLLGAPVWSMKRPVSPHTPRAQPAPVQPHSDVPARRTEAGKQGGPSHGLGMRACQEGSYSPGCSCRPDLLLRGSSSPRPVTQCQGHSLCARACPWRLLSWPPPDPPGRGRSTEDPPPPTQSSRATASKETRLPCIPGSLLAPAGPSPLSNISPDPPHKGRAGTSLPTPQAAPGVTGQGPWPTRFCASDWHSKPLPGGPLLKPSQQLGPKSPSQDPPGSPWLVAGLLWPSRLHVGRRILLCGAGWAPDSRGAA